MFRRQICYTEMTGFLQLTIKIWKSHHVCEDRMLCVWVEFYVYLCGQQHPKCERVIRLLCPPLFCKLRSSFDPTNKQTSNASETREGRTVPVRFKHLYFGNHSELDTCSYELLLLMTDTITFKKYWLSSWLALRMYPHWKPLRTLCSWSGCWPIRRPWIIVVLLTEYKDFGCAVAWSR